jgi:hypothetical protein
MLKQALKSETRELWTQAISEEPESLNQAQTWDVVVPHPAAGVRAFPRTFFGGWVACGYGIPHVLLTRNGSQFISKFFQTFCRTLEVKQVFTSTYRPFDERKKFVLKVKRNSDGTIERYKHGLCYSDICSVPKLTFSRHTHQLLISQLRELHLSLRIG